MKILFTKSKLPGSKIITWGLDEPVSHTAIQFGDGEVMHSTMSQGLTRVCLEEFLEHREIVYEINLEVPVFQEYRTKAKFIYRYRIAKYDYTAFLYLTWRAFLRKIFSIPFPQKNKWAVDGRFMCTEAVTKLLYGEEKAMITPYKLYLRLKEFDTWQQHNMD